VAEPTLDERLRHITLKLARAKEHQAELNRLLSTFLGTAPYKVATKRHPENRKLIYYVASAELVPDSIPLVAGDAIQNLMSTLDHLAYQLVCRDTTDQPPNPGWIYFPIADDAATYDSKKGGKMQGARAATVSAIDALRPFKGGNDLLWSLYRLNNIEKHRLLLTVGAQAAGIHLGQLIAMHLPPSFGGDAARALESMDLYLNPADKGFPLSAGFELYIGGADEEPNPKLQFRFMVVLSEPGIVEGQPLVEAVAALTGEVERVVTALTPLLR
jgi:hypothetical protein